MNIYLLADSFYSWNCISTGVSIVHAAPWHLYGGNCVSICWHYLTLWHLNIIELTILLSSFLFRNAAYKLHCRGCNVVIESHKHPIAGLWHLYGWNCADSIMMVFLSIMLCAWELMSESVRLNEVRPIHRLSYSSRDIHRPMSIIVQLVVWHHLWL